MKRKRQQGKRRKSKKTKNSTSSSEIVVKNFEIFVTDFLTDPCGLPLELKDCILVDGTKPIDEHSGKYMDKIHCIHSFLLSDNSSLSNNSTLLKKIFNHSLTVDGERKVRNFFANIFFFSRKTFQIVMII